MRRTVVERLSSGNFTLAPVSLRLAAIGRKNYLFVGNQRSGQVTATLLSLIETAKANGLEPLAYLTRTMRELPLIAPESSDADARYEALLPI